MRIFIFRLSSKTFRINERILSPIKIKNAKVTLNKQSSENSERLNLINKQLTKIDELLNIDTLNRENKEDDNNTNNISSTLILNDVLTHLYVQMPKLDKLMEDQNNEIVNLKRQSINSSNTESLINKNWITNLLKRFKQISSK